MEKPLIHFELQQITNDVRIRWQLWCDQMCCLPDKCQTETGWNDLYSIFVCQNGRCTCLVYCGEFYTFYVIFLVLVDTKKIIEKSPCMNITDSTNRSLCAFRFVCFHLNHLTGERLLKQYRFENVDGMCVLLWKGENERAGRVPRQRSSASQARQKQEKRWTLKTHCCCWYCCVFRKVKAERTQRKFSILCNSILLSSPCAFRLYDMRCVSQLGQAVFDASPVRSVLYAGEKKKFTTLCVAAYFSTVRFCLNAFFLLLLLFLLG